MPPELTDAEFAQHRWIPLHDAVTDRSGPELQAIIAAGNFPPIATYRGGEYVTQVNFANWQHAGYGRMLHDSGLHVHPETGQLVPKNWHANR